MAYLLSNPLGLAIARLLARLARCCPAVSSWQGHELHPRGVWDGEMEASFPMREEVKFASSDTPISVDPCGRWRGGCGWLPIGGVGRGLEGHRPILDARTTQAGSHA